MMLRLPCALIAGLLVLPAPVTAEVYRWTDAAGNTIYSDRPPAGAEPAPAAPRRNVNRSQRDQRNISRLAERERRLLAAMQAHREQQARPASADAAAGCNEAGC